MVVEVVAPVEFQGTVLAGLTKRQAVVTGQDATEGYFSVVCEVSCVIMVVWWLHHCLYGDAPSYLVDLITPSAAASTRAGLRSAESMTIAMPCTLSSLQTALL